MRDRRNCYHYGTVGCLDWCATHKTWDKCDKCPYFDAIELNTALKVSSLTGAKISANLLKSPT